MNSDDLVNVLANRRGPFLDMGIPVLHNFSPLSLTGDALKLHQDMFLDFEGNDHYLIAYLSALLSQPDAAYYFDQPSGFDLSKFGPTGVTITGGKFSHTGETYGRYTGEDQELPLAFNYRLTYYDPHNILATAVEKNSTTLLPYTLQSDSISTVLQLVWPPHIPFEGSLVLGQAWTTTSTIGITVRPHNFPYWKIIEKVRYNPYVQQILQSLQLLEEFNLSLDSVEQISYLLIALALNRKAEHVENIIEHTSTV